MKQNKNNFFYIYNLVQANFFLMNGLTAMEVGKGNRGDVYVKFARNAKSEEVFDRWVKRGQELNG